MIKVIDKVPDADKKFNSDNPLPNSSWAPYKVFNIGNSSPVKLLRYIEAIENEVGLKAEKIMLPMQPGDVEATIADTSNLENWIGFKPNTPVKKGVKNFVNWYMDFYKQK